MQLLPFSVLFVLGFGVWLTGHFFNYKGVAAIGAAFIIIAGSAVALTGLVVPDGHVEKVDDVGGQDETHFVTPTYKPIELAGIDSTSALGSLGLGGLFLILGGVLFSQTLAKELD